MSPARHRAVTARSATDNPSGLPTGRVSFGAHLGPKRRLRDDAVFPPSKCCRNLARAMAEASHRGDTLRARRGARSMTQPIPLTDSDLVDSDLVIAPESRSK